MKKMTVVQLAKNWKGKISLVVVDPESYREACSSLLSGLLKASRSANCIYISTTMPYAEASRMLQKNGLDAKRLFFIDTMSKSASLGKERAENVIFVEDPKNLTMVGVALSEALYKMEGKERVLILDSISSLLMYNSPDIVLRFLHSVIGRMRAGEVSGIVFILVKDYGDILTRLASFVDEVVELQ